MTKEEFYRLPRFKKEDHVFAHNGRYNENDIFEIKTLHKTIAYLKVIKNFFNTVLLFHECDAKGELINLEQGYFEGNVSNVKSLIEEEGFWRVYKPELTGKYSMEKNTGSVTLASPRANSQLG